MTTTWPEVSLGSLCDIQIGRTPPRAQREYWDGDHPWLSISDMNQGREITTTSERITETAVRKLKCRQVEPGTVLLSFKLSIGKVGITTTPLYTNEAIAHLPIVDPRLDRDYLYWALQAIPLTAGADRAAMGSTLNKAKLQTLPIPLPPLDEQRRIAAVLDAAEALRAKRRQALAKLDTLTQAIFIDMFGDLASWSGPTCKLTDLADLQIGYPFKSSTFTSDGSGVRICRGINVAPGEIKWDEPACVPTEVAKARAGYQLRTGDVVVAMDRPWISSGFKVAPVDNRAAGSLLVQRVARLRATADVPPEFLYHVLRQPAFSRHCSPTETTIPHISPNDFQTFEMPRPMSDQLKHFRRACVAVDVAREASTRQSAHLDALFASLQQRAFRGEL